MSDHNELTVEQLLDVDWYKNHQGVPQRVIKQAFQNCLANSNVTLSRKGDTILVVDHVNKDFHFINAEPFDTFTQNVKVLLSSCGETVIHTDFTNPRIIEVAKHAGVNFSVTNTDSGYLMTVRL